MSKKRKSVVQLATEAEARVKLETARFKLDRIKMAKKASRAAFSTHQAASRNRSNRDWRAANVSADSEIIEDLPVLVARARQMVRDDAYAASIVRAFKRNVIGRGISPSFAARGPDGKSLEVFNRMADEAWFDWSSRAELADVERRRTFAQIQQWVAGELVITGEALVIWSYDADRAAANRLNGLVLQCVESEQLNTTIITYNGNEVRGGVEVDHFGGAVAYHFWTRHPNDHTGGYYDGARWKTPDRIPDEPNGDEKSHINGSAAARSIRVEANRVMHIFDPERARQSRGVSRLRSVMMRLRDISQFEYAELVKARAQACIGMAIESEPINQQFLGLEPGSGIEEQDSDGNDELSAQPLMVARLSPGEKIQAFAPTSPGGQFGPFMMAELRSVAAGVGLSYEQIARDFSQGTYSSQRQGMLEDRREWGPLQELIIRRFCQPVLEQFVEWSVAEGRLPAPGFAQQPTRFTYAEWMPDGWQWIDPAKEAQAAQIALDANLDTKQRLMLERGLDWREVARQRAEEKAFETKVTGEAAEPTGVPVDAPVEEEAPA